MSEPDNLAIARISGAASRLTLGLDRDMPRDLAKAELKAISRDPHILGIALGDVLHQMATESRGHQLTAELLRQCGANENTAAKRLAWQQAGRPRRFTP